MAGVHGVAPGRTAVVVIETVEALEFLDVLRASGTTIARVIAPSALADRVPAGLPVLRDGAVLEAKGRRHVTAVVVRAGGREETIACDTLVLSLGFAPRDSLLRQAPHCQVDGAGDVLTPGLSVSAAIESGRTAASHRAGVAMFTDTALVAPTAGIVCTCEDVGASELAQAWREGFRSTELLKRYTTATMGPCQGALCHPHLRAFVRARTPDTRVAAPTTARPPARGMTIEDAAAGMRGAIEQRTALHDRHIAAGARMDWAGAWKRAAVYGDPTAEYWAVRRNVSIMDVGTLGKFLVHGPVAPSFLDRLCPSNVLGLKVGRSRYTLYLNEAGYIIDDGMIVATGDHEFFVTATSSGADSAEAWMRDWVEAWGLRVHIVNQTPALGAINVAGPRARDLLASLTTDPIDSASLPYSGARRMTVAGIPCLVLRVGFTGELSFELHHARSRSIELWDALSQAGRTLQLLPHGLDTLKLLRLEKGHILIGQDTDFDTTPAKIGLDSLVKYDKPFFLGQSSLRRLSKIPAQRQLMAIKFPGDVAPDEGAQLMVGDERVGWVTSSRYSPGLQHGVALGWVTARNGAFPTDVVAVSRGGRRTAGTAVSGAFYDPKGERLRA
jgi:sarcosine oxidase subunit alpha